MPDNNKVVLPKQNLFPADPKYINHTYGVLLKYPDTATSLHYEIECKFCQHTYDNDFILSLNRKQVFVNDEIPEIKLYQMADQMAKAFYPVLLRVGRDDKKIKAIANYQDIAARCEQTYNQLSRDFDGDLASAFAEQYFRQYSNINTLTERLENELFYKLYCFPLYGSYSSELAKNSEYSFPFNTADNDPILKIAHRIEPDYTADYKIIVNLKSIAAASTESDLFDGKVSFNAQYDLYADDQTVCSILGSAAYQGISGERNKIEFEVYHLDPENRIPQPKAKEQQVTTAKQQDSIIIESDVREKKKSFWNIFN